MALLEERRRRLAGEGLFDDARKLQIVRAEPNITLLLEHRMNAAAARDGLVRHVVCEDVRTARRLLVPGRWFADCTGDGCLGFLVGADFEHPYSELRLISKAKIELAREPDLWAPSRRAST